MMEPPIRRNEHILQHGIIGIEFQGTVETELFFVYPVGNTVQYTVQLAVFSHLRFAVAIQKLYQEDVIITDKRHQVSVRREYRACCGPPSDSFSTILLVVTPLSFRFTGYR